MRRFVAAAAAFTAAAVTAGTLIPAGPAGAATVRCRAYGSMPARAALHGKQVVVHSVLRGTAGCYGQPTDNGATALLHAPGTPAEELRYRHFGSAQDIVLNTAVVHTGTYRIAEGDVQVYDANYERVSSAWQPTTMTVKWAAGANHVTARAGRVTGREVASSKFGLTAHYKPVYVQRRPVGRSAWRTLGSTRPGSGGWFSYVTPTNRRFQYRVVFYATSTVWGATSAPVRG